MVDLYIKQLKQVENAFIAAKAELQIHEKACADLACTLSMLVDTQTNIEKARIVVQEVANEIQQNIEFHISSIVSLALASVFPDPYEFKVNFVTRRNQTECDMFFVKDGNECDPMDSSGGGALDIASLALRMAIWSIKQTRAIQILDEPAKFLSRDMQDKASDMLKKLSESLGIQLIIISHIPEIMEAADRIIHVEQVNGTSKVKTL